MFDLRSFREGSLKLTQNELATLIDERQDKISRLEKNPTSIGLDILIKIADKTGTTLDELVNYKKMMPKPIQLKDTWGFVHSLKRSSTSYLDKAMGQTTEDHHLSILKEIKHFVETTLVKPKVAVVGLSDTGKSTLINALLGQEILPVAWTPTTAINLYIKHLDDRPTYIKDDVWFFRAQKDQAVGWDSRRIEEELYTKAWLVDKGHIKDLEELAIREGADQRDIASAVVFIDCPILKNCDIVDLPGYNTGDRQLDSSLTEQVKDYADILIYMSLANGFMRGNDIEYIKSNLNNLPIIEHQKHNNDPLCNLFIVASQAHVVNKGNHGELTTILDEGAQRLYGQIPPDQWMQRRNVTGIVYSEEKFRARFFTYTKDIDVLRQPFEAGIIKLIERYPNLLIEKYRASLIHLCSLNKSILQQEIEENQTIIHHREGYSKLLKRLYLEECNRYEATEAIEKHLLNQLQNLMTESKAEMKQVYEDLISVESIIRIIDEEDFTNRTRNLELLGGLLNSQLQSKVQEIIGQKVTYLTKEINTFLKGYDDLIVQTTNQPSSDVKFIFDAKRAFTRGLREEESLGGLVLWAADDQDFGNYLLVGKGVNILSSLLRTMSGLPEFIYSPAGLSAQGGGYVAMGSEPIELVIGLGILAISSGLAIFGSGWKKSASKKIVAAYSNEHVLEKYTRAFDQFWMTTEQAFRSGSENMTSRYHEEVAYLNAKVNDYNVEQLKDSIHKAEAVKALIDGIPSPE